MTEEKDPIQNLSKGSDSGLINTATGLFSKAIDVGLEVVRIKNETGQDLGAVHPTGQTNPERQAPMPEVPSVSNASAQALKYAGPAIGIGVIVLVGFFVFTAIKGRK
jgi:hypothetical protein